jgi:hypothetical protein
MTNVIENKNGGFINKENQFKPENLLDFILCVSHKFEPSLAIFMRVEGEKADYFYGVIEPPHPT